MNGEEIDSLNELDISVEELEDRLEFLVIDFFSTNCSDHCGVFKCHQFTSYTP